MRLIGVTERKSLAPAPTLPTRKFPELSLSREAGLEATRKPEREVEGEACVRLCGTVRRHTLVVVGGVHLNPRE